MEDATIQKLWIDTLFRGTKVAMNVLRKMEIWHGSHTSTSVLLYTQWHFFKCEIPIVGNFETILSVNVTKERLSWME